MMVLSPVGAIVGQTVVRLELKAALVPGGLPGALSAAKQPAPAPSSEVLHNTAMPAMEDRGQWSFQKPLVPPLGLLPSLRTTRHLPEAQAQTGTPGTYAHSECLLLVPEGLAL